MELLRTYLKGMENLCAYYYYWINLFMCLFEQTLKSRDTDVINLMGKIQRVREIENLKVTRGWRFVGHTHRLV